jgi:NAD kinase
MTLGVKRWVHFIFKMNLNKILCIVKKTELEKYKINPKTILPAGIKKWLTLSHNNHSKFLKKFKQIALKHELPITYITTNQVEKTKSNFDLVITVGGDGAFLLATKYFKSIPLLGFNSNSHKDPKQGSIGALTSGNVTNLEARLKALKKGKFSIKLLSSLRIRINEKWIQVPTINELYLGNNKPYKSSDLTIIYNKKEERFNCSGILASTYTGSTAWYKNAGGKKFKPNNFAFLIREPNRDRQPSFNQSTLTSKEFLTIYPNSPGHIISLDSKDKIIPLKTFDKVQISLSEKNKIRVIQFKD